MEASARPAPVSASVLAGFLRRGGINGAVCIGIAALLAALPGARFAETLVHSLLIGTLCWLAIDGGRVVVARRRARRDGGDAAARAGWPGWGWMASLIVLGVAVGYPLGTLAARAVLGDDSPLPSVSRGFVLLLLLSLAVAASVTGFFYVRGRLDAARAEAEAAQRSAAEAQLKLLQAQLEPHMLFNTLANLRVLIGADPPRATALLDRLIAFLRATLAASRSGRTQTLDSEFARVADYLALMELRMGPRLAVRLDLPDALRSLPVPPLLLQPLVENAIRHGLEPQVAGGSIEVSARRDGATLRLQVRDNGAGLPAPAAAAPSAAAPATAAAGGTRFGLQQVRERLAALYGARARLVLDGADGGGTVARIELPIDDRG